MLEDNVALVTGAAGDIGAATTRLLLARGARVFGVDRDGDALRRLSAEIDRPALLATYTANVTRETEVRAYIAATVTAFGRLDIFFNNAGIEGPIHPLTDYPLEDFERVFGVNVIGVFLGLKYAIPTMRAQGGGAIINASSTAGLTGSPGVCAYNASKHAVIGLTRSAAAKGVRINCIAPGPINSRMMRSIEDGMQPGAGQAIRARLTEAIPAGRYGEPEEVAALVAFLASDDAPYLRGSVYAVDGGYLLH